VSSPAAISAHACSKCARKYVVVIGAEGAQPRCTCGGELTSTSLAEGMYELRKPRRAARRAAAEAVSPTSDAGVPRAPDLGYGESHGYGPAHGGPTGPGDAPATEPVAVEDLPPPAENTRVQ
jgi:hypothetical protein